MILVLAPSFFNLLSTQLYKKQILEFFFPPRATKFNFLSPRNRPFLRKNYLKDQNLAYMLVGKYKKWAKNSEI